MMTDDDLIAAARTQPTPQTLLMVFVDVELPPDASLDERTRFEQGQGGALTPRMCLDRAAAELTDWPTLSLSLRNKLSVNPYYKPRFGAYLYIIPVTCFSV